VSLTSPQQVGNFLVYGEVTGKCVCGFWALRRFTTVIFYYYCWSKLLYRLP